jgi:hypothetical protein
MLKLIAFCALFLACFSGIQAQNCGTVTTTAPSGIQFGHNSGGYQTFQNNSTTFVESSDYYFTASPPAMLNFSYDLASSSNANPQVTAYTTSLYYRDGNGTGLQACSGNIPFSVTSQNTNSFYFSVPADKVPVNTRFLVRLTLTVSNTTNADIIGSGFKLDSRATQLPVNSTLPVHFISMDARKQGMNTIINWKVGTELNTLNYELERSADGKIFEQVNSTKAIRATDYSLTDISVPGVVYYRIRSNDIDGRFIYSPIIKVTNGAASFVKRLFPMPVHNELLIQHGLFSNATLLSLYSADGKLLANIHIAPGSMETRIDMSSYRSGIYFLRFTDNTGLLEMINISKE